MSDLDQYTLAHKALLDYACHQDYNEERDRRAQELLRLANIVRHHYRTLAQACAELFA